MAIQQLTDLEDFEREIRPAGDPDDDMIQVVKFTAKKCRGCIAMNPKFNALVKKHDGVTAQFFEVKSEEARLVFGQERVVRTPTVLYYASGIGRINGFAFGDTPAAGTFLKDDFERTLARVDALRGVRRQSLYPAMRYTALVGLLRALVGAEARLKEEERGAALRAATERAEAARQASSAGASAVVAEAAKATAAKAAADAASAAYAAALFDWIDIDDSRGLSQFELMRVVDAVGGMQVITGRVGAGGGSGLYDQDETIDEKIRRAIDLVGTDGELDLATVTKLLQLHMAYEKAKLKPEAEARAAYALLDAEGTGGKVPTKRAAARISAMTDVLPLPGLDDECSVESLEALFETFDLEERGYTSFEAFARIVMRSSPSVW